MAYNSPDRQYDAPDDGDGTTFTREQYRRLQGLVPRNLNIARAVDDLLQRMAVQVVKAAPAPVAPYRHTGSTFYVDPTVAPGGSGTFASPFNSAASVTWAAGIALLFKAGTTTALGATYLQPSVSGTAANPIVIGVYDPATGEEIINGGIGLATINCSGLLCGPALNNVNYVRVEGLKVINANSADHGLIHIQGSSANNQVLNCDCSDSPTNSGIRHETTGANNVIEGNKATGNAQPDIYARLSAADNTTLRITYNQAGDIWCYSPTTYKFSGTVAGNTVDGAAIGITIECGGGAPQVFRNTALRQTESGIGIKSSTTTPADFSGALLQGNYVDYCKFGVATQNIRGSWLIEFNRVRRSGTLNGIAQIDETGYGRGIEIFGPNVNEPSADGTVRWNTVTESFSFRFDATEGVGIGLDNNSRHVRCYGNIISDCEGNGIQVNDTYACSVYGNLVVNSVCAPASRPITIDDRLAAGIVLTQAHRTRVFNNTIIGRNANHRFGINDNAAPGFTSRACEHYNNLIIGATVAGLYVNNEAGMSTERANIVANAPLAVRRLTGTAVPGAGTLLVDVAAVIEQAETYIPVAGGPCDSAGVAVPPGAQTIDGSSLADRTPIGAFRPRELVIA